MNRREQVQKIRNAVNPRYIRSVLMDLSVFHRQVASDQIMASAEKARDLMTAAGLNAKLYTFTNVEDYCLKTPCDMQWSFWQATDGWCEVVGEEGRKIADYHSDPICILRESVSCDYRENPVEVVYMDRGTKEEDYADVDFTGKVIFFKNSSGAVNITAAQYVGWAVRRGAVGYISGVVSTELGIRGAWNQYETIAWARVYPGVFGFGITPKEADRLERIYNEKKAKGEGLFVRCYIDSEARDVGTMANAEAIIEGENTEEEVLMFAHLCHPRPSANDNLSGCSAVLAAMYALNDLISRGMLPKPKRNIRGIVGPEMRGSLAEIWRKDRVNTRATFNMDMVGTDQGNPSAGPVFLADAPRSTPNVTNDVASFCLREITKDVHNRGVGWLCTHNMAYSPFSADSDQDMWNDPMLDAPCAYMGQTPDPFYHSSSDDISVIDPTLIARSAAVAASYAYVMATLDISDLPILMAQGCENMARFAAWEEYNGDDKAYATAMRHLRDYYLASCDKYATFFDGDDREKALEVIAIRKENIVSTLGGMASSVLGKKVDLDDYPCDGRDLDAKYQFVPCREFIGRIWDLPGYAKRQEGGAEKLREYNKNKKAVALKSADVISMYYVNGERTFAECISRAMVDCKVENTAEVAEAVYDYYKLLIDLGLITVK